MILKRLKNNGIPELKLNSLQIEMKKIVEEKIKNNVYKFEQTNNCVICNSEEFEIIGEKDRYGLYYSVKICNDCGLLFTDPRMDQESYNQFYNLDYRKLYGGVEEVSKQFFKDQYSQGKSIFDFLKKHKLLSNSPMFVLEVGCGAGGILKYFKDKGHYIKGIDLGEEYIFYGQKKHNLDLEKNNLENLVIKNKPDIIIYSHVLEHILDVNKELDLIKRISGPNTIIYIEVPGVKNIHKDYRMNILRYFQNAHTYHFSLTTLCNLFSNNGFNMIKGNEYVKSVFKIGEKPMDIVNDKSQMLRYLKIQEKYRKLFIVSSNGIKKGINKIIKFLR